jgi:hypothetical protein
MDTPFAMSLPVLLRCPAGTARLAILLVLVMFNRGAAAAEPDSADVSYRRDIRQILSRAGCNAGPCHGNANGKGGFKLSLRGEDPAADHRALTEEWGGRRIDPFIPTNSLLLLKATATLAHEGGRRFNPNSWEYTSLAQWIASGAIDDSTRAPVLARLEVSPRELVIAAPQTNALIQAIAHFTDGTRRDVTREAVYEPVTADVRALPDGTVERLKDGESVVLVRYLDQQQPVRLAFIPDRPGFNWSGPGPANFIDNHIFAKLRTRQQLPAGDVSDALFLRRLHLDLLGLPPTAPEARAFVRDPSPDKRARAIDAALERPEFADFWALKWSDLLRVEERTLDRKGMIVFHRWIRDAIARNQPLDVMARELVSARGSTYSHPPANFHRANRTPIDRALAVSQVFLGTRLNCAQCHNHPFDRWSQDDYHDWAAVFARVQTKVLRNDRRDENDSHEFSGEQIVFVSSNGEVPNPRTGQSARPRLLGETAPLDPGTDPARDELDALGEWLTRHPQFARVQVNRIWFHLFGRGLVDPIDDFRSTNPASHPELLDALAAESVRSGHDLRHLLRLMLRSRTYQFSSVPDPTAANDEVNHSHTRPRRLAAEPLLDAQARVLGAELQFKGWPKGTRAAQLPGGAPQKEGRKTPTDRFLETFGKPPRLLTCECERSDASTLAQALQLISGPVLHELITRPDNQLARWADPELSPDRVIDDIFWSVLTRPPGPDERERFTRILANSTDRRATLEDFAWALLNSKEFILRH